MTSTTARTATATFYVAVPANEPTSGIYGIGTSEEAVVQDAYEGSQTRPATVSPHDFLPGRWVVDHDGEEVATFDDEGRAREEAAMLGFSPRECTERLYLYVKDHGAAVGELRYVERDGLQDLDISEEDLAAALAEVDAGIEGADARALADLKAEDALADAREYVDAYVWQDEDSDIESVVEDDREFRFALELAVRDRLLGLIAERDAA